MTAWWNKELWPANPGDRIILFGWRPKRVPRAYWLQVRGARFFFQVLYVALVVGWIVAALSANWWITQVFLLSAVLVSFLWQFVSRRTFRKWKRYVKSQEWHCCLDCGYSLRGLPASHVCPECGTPYDLPEVEAAWQAWVKTGRLPKPIPDK